ncbi:hypothetical protein ACJMK2_032616 [Sinanodonta woodiana]|uniref:Translation factor GUF1 homolog, mitochondrial n=1 Tax=Sinanodonta woodiana TaxID=1069815 RepID=A0ABD3X5U0_SINWO
MLTQFKFIWHQGVLKRYIQKSLSRRNLLKHTRCFSCAPTLNEKKKVIPDLSQFPVENIRNFCIIAHIDHGKSTLADRLLEVTGTISKSDKNEQVLDRLQVERERGITVKAQTATLFYSYNGQSYMLNLIDTPGHVDFNYEVSRSLTACQGVILLVDANQGVQAQTVANFYLAFEADLTIIPVLNKIDLKNAKPEVVMEQMKNIFEIEPKDVLKVSAKLGTGVNELLEAIVERIPPPKADVMKPLRALVFDTYYDQYRGVITDVAVIDGCIKKGDKLQSSNTKKSYQVQDLGIHQVDEILTHCLYAGQVGYVVMNMKNVKEGQIGDTLVHEGSDVQPHPGFKQAKPMVFAGVYPTDQSKYDELRSAIEKLTLNDSSVSIHIDHSPALGQGWRLGFLGLLHMDVFQQRLEQEFSANVIVTAPNVPYKVKIFGAKNIKMYGGEEVTVLNPCLMPEQEIIKEYYEPLVRGTIIAPDDYVGEMTNLCLGRRGVMKEQIYIDSKRIMFTVILPLNEILVDFYDDLKAVTSGYASFDYEDHGYVPSNLVKITYLLNGKEVEELTMINHVTTARTLARRVCLKLKENIPRQLFKISVQAAVGGNIIAREDIPAYRKDVLAKCYGGDITRKTKLLKQQAEGKKKMRAIGNIDVPKDVFITVLKK